MGRGQARWPSGARLPLAVSNQGTLLKTGPQATVRSSSGNHSETGWFGLRGKGRPRPPETFLGPAPGVLLLRERQYGTFGLGAS